MLLDKFLLLVNYLFTHYSYCLNSDEPAFAEGKTFEELMTEIDRIKNQLPCKHVSVPETSADLGKYIHNMHK